METFLRYMYWISVAMVGLCFLAWQLMGAPTTTSWIELGYITSFFLLCTGFMLERRLKVVSFGRDLFGRRREAHRQLFQAILSSPTYSTTEQQAKLAAVFVKVVMGQTSNFDDLRPLDSAFKNTVHLRCYYDIESLEKVMKDRSSSAKQKAAARAEAAKLNSVMEWINQSDEHERNPINHAY